MRGRSEKSADAGRGGWVMNWKIVSAVLAVISLLLFLSMRAEHEKIMGGLQRSCEAEKNVCLENVPENKRLSTRFDMHAASLMTSIN